MKLDQIELVLAQYIKQEVIPAIPNPIIKFALAGGSFLAIGKFEKLIEQYLTILQSMDIIDKEGNIDIDSLYSAAKEGLKATGGKLDIKGLIFNQNDIDKLYSMLKGVK